MVSSTRRIRLDADADPVHPFQVLLRTLDLVRSLTRPAQPQTQTLTTTLFACTGLAPESLSILFQRFQQASSSTHTVFGGSGLGVCCVPFFCPNPYADSPLVRAFIQLYVCRLITGLMNGRIEVDSVKGEGSTFRFFIECTTPDEAGDIGQTVDVKPIVIQFPHVLVVEGELLNCTIAQACD